jgi:hypothetical protein
MHAQRGGLLLQVPTTAVVLAVVAEAVLQVLVGEGVAALGAA